MRKDAAKVRKIGAPGEGASVVVASVDVGMAGRGYLLRVG